jgi:hypothetical protein
MKGELKTLRMLKLRGAATRGSFFAGIPEGQAAHCGRNSIRKFGFGGYAGKRPVHREKGRTTQKGRVPENLAAGQPSCTSLKRKRDKGADLAQA